VKRPIIALALLMFLASCGETSTDLGNGYKFIELDAANYVIENKDHAIVVYPNITEYKIVGGYVVGIREKSRSVVEAEHEFTTGFGYFILDMNTGAYVGGLRKDQLDERLVREKLKNPL
jgi:hypothetical protein